MSSGDRVQAENYLQHAEHYLRIINQIQESENRQRGGQPSIGHAGHQPQGASQAGDDDDQQGEDETDGEERAAVNA